MLDSGVPEWAKISGAMLLPNLGGWIQGYATRNEIKDWYKKLNKPVGTPPDWVFGPVWAALYSGMGLASYLVWRDGGGFTGEAKVPLALYATQLAINQMWTPIFFLKHDIPLAMADILALLAAAGATTVAFYKVNKTAAYLMIPYLGWTAYATYLNYGFLTLNPAKKQIKK